MNINNLVYTGIKIERKIEQKSEEKLCRGANKKISNNLLLTSRRDFWI